LEVFGKLRSPKTSKTGSNALDSGLDMRSNHKTEQRDLRSCPPSELSFADLEWLVIVDPDNAAARREWLIRNGKISASNMARSDIEPKPDGISEEFTEQLNFDCPKCGGTLHFNPGIVGLQCLHCGYLEPIRDERVKPQDTPLGATLASDQGYRRAIAQRVLRCEQCGALTIFPPAQISMICPYCDSGVFATAPEDARLITPQILLPTRLDANIVRQEVKKWLSKDIFAPGDWAQASVQKLAPLYIPLWLISAAIRFNDPNGPSLLGKRDFLYIDWVIPGVPHLSAQHIRALKPFNWKELVEFNPEYLARWPTTHYEVSLERASRTACTEIREATRARLPWRVFDSGSFYCQSYKLVLFPVWITSLRYKGKSYRLLVNGQTGKVAGDRPLSWVRLIGFTAGACAIFILAGVGLLFALNAWIPRMAATFSPTLGLLGNAWILLLPVIAMLLILVIAIFKE
jgi:Zn finger protein HypA/HybF involved in hydrogenase expression